MVATDNVWNEISSHLNYKMSSGALHTLVKKGRYNIKEKLGITSESRTRTISPISTQFSLQSGKFVVC